MGLLSATQASSTGTQPRSRKMSASSQRSRFTSSIDCFLAGGATILTCDTPCARHSGGIYLRALTSQNQMKLIGTSDLGVVRSFRTTKRAKFQRFAVQLMRNRHGNDPNWLGVDFGTSNSAAAYMSAGDVVHVELEEGRETIPTALFFDLYEKQVLTGRRANQALLDGAEGRYMRSLKSVLGTSLMKEQRILLGRRTDFSEVITEFLRQLKARAENFADRTFDHVVAGRPVFFHRVDADRNRRAELDLEACYHKAGFKEVRFMYEPEAAALESARDYKKGSVGLVVDIGGGTSDFTLFEAKDQGVRIIASNGVRVGGTDFDRQISYDHFMPLLGRGASLTRQFAEGTIQAPAHIFSELATWEKIPFLYDGKTIQLAKGMERDAVDRPAFTRLVKVLERRLGHDLAFEAERTKIARNEGSNHSTVDLSLIEPGLQTQLTEEGFENSLLRFGEEIADAIQETLDAGGVEARRVEAVVSVGGSSSMKIVTDAIQSGLPNVAVQQGDVFTSIVEGLAIASQAT